MGDGLILTEHDLNRGKNLLVLSKCMAKLIILREKVTTFDAYPKGSVITKSTRRTYYSKRLGQRNYKNYFRCIDVDGKQLYVGKQRFTEEELREKYENYDPNDYTIKENIPIICNKLLDKKRTEQKLSELKQQAEALIEELNLQKNKNDDEITDEYAENLGKIHIINTKYAEDCRLVRKRKTYIARYAAQEQLQNEFQNARQAAFYIAGGKMIENRLNEPMRSRAELLVAEILQELGIEYVYEYYVKDAGVSCDFLIYVCGREYYLEILGMMDREEYRQHWINKEAAYKRAGIEKGENLIVFDLSSRDYINLSWLESVLIGLAAGNIPSSTVYGIENIQDAKHLKERAENFAGFAAGYQNAQTA